MRGRNLQTLAAQGGQFFGWRFMAKGHALISHPYSLSAAPTAHYMRITVKDLGDHSRSVADLKPGTRVFMEGPYGAFTAGRGSRKIHPMNAKSLEALVPRFADSDIYICGPAPLVDAVREAAENLGVPKNRFHDEAFAFHSE
jgi:predicted ferric reductase